MIWKITFLLASFSLLITAPRTEQGQSSSSNVIPQISHAGPQEYLEVVYDLRYVQSIIDMKTFDQTSVLFDTKDATILTTECPHLDMNCIVEKMAVVKKYQQKMQAIQCVSGLYVLRLWDDLNEITVDMRKNNGFIDSHQETVEQFLFHLTSMLTVLNVAEWDAYAWQIQIFAFLSALAAQDLDVETLLEHYLDYIVPIKDQLESYVDTCVQYGYLLSLDHRVTEKLPVFEFVESLYNGNSVIDIEHPRQFYTVPNLLLQYESYDFIFDWSMYNIELDTSNVDRRGDFTDELALNPFGGCEYNVLIAKHIRLRAMFVAWFQMRIYLTIYDRLFADDEAEDCKENLINSWNIFAPYLKRILRTVGFEEDIYWTGLYIMAVDLVKVNKTELKQREFFTRHSFCRSVWVLGLAYASDMNTQLEKFEIENDLINLHLFIEGNVELIKSFCDQIERASNPARQSTYRYDIRHGSYGFIRTLVAAAENQTFVVR